MGSAPSGEKENTQDTVSLQMLKSGKTGPDTGAPSFRREFFQVEAGHEPGMRDPHGLQHAEPRPWTNSGPTAEPGHPFASAGASHRVPPPSVLEGTKGVQGMGVASNNWFDRILL